MAKSKTTDPENWRKRYYEQGEQHDALKERYREHVELLQRILSRLCLTVDDSVPEFEREIRELRKKLRGELSSLPSLAESLADIDQLLLAQQEHDESIRVSLPASTGTTPQKRGLWQRLRKRFVADDRTQFPDSDEERIEVVPEDFVELPGADQLKEVLESTPGYGAIASKVADTLNSLLSQMSYPESAQKDLQALRLRIAGRVNWYELPPTLEDLSSLILASIGKGQRQFDNFLHELDQQLNSMSLFLQEHDQRDQTWLELSLKLHDAIHQQGQSLSSRAFDSRSPEVFEAQLKKSIREHLEDISEITVGYVKRGEKLSAGFKPQLDEMQGKLKRLVQEQKALRSKLKQERKLALTDTLTELPNREAYDERLEFEYLRWLRYRNPAVIVAGDIDHFQDINDRFGHLSGDRTLQIIAKELRKRIRNTDFIARYGGEEFVLVLPLTKLDVAKEVIEKLRRTVASLPFHFRAQRVQLTMAFGLVEFDECEHFSRLTDRAELALTRAKTDGRNCVRVWTE